MGTQSLMDTIPQGFLGDERRLPLRPDGPDDRSETVRSRQFLHRGTGLRRGGARAAANLNSTYVRLVQQTSDGRKSELVTDTVENAPVTAFKIVEGRSHSGKSLGILRSVTDDGAQHSTVDAVLRCLSVSTPRPT